jgi:hypothetical protein
MPVLRTLVVPGLPHADNRNALDWGWEGLIAYGCQSVVVVIDPRSVQPLQTLAHHKSSVIRLRWCHQRRHHTLAAPYSLRLASVDASSLCVIWDVGQAAVVAEFSLGNKPLVDLQWLATDVSSPIFKRDSSTIVQFQNGSQCRTQVRSCWQ